MTGDSSVFNLLFALGIGISLSAACGFRTFVPFLVVSVANRYFGFSVGSGFEWIGSTPAFVILLTATIVEILAYYIPWVDNALDAVNAPLALVAGTIVMSGMLPDLPPAFKWCLSGVVGGGAAGVVKGTATLVRGTSTATTGGIGNNVVASFENFLSTLFSVLAIVMPILAFLISFVALVTIFLLGRKLFRMMKGRRHPVTITG